MYYYDNYGWLTTETITGRSTLVVPPVETAELKANWTGTEWVLTTYTSPPSPVPPVLPVWTWFIDIGPFFDRFGAFKMAVLTSSDPGIKAIIQDVSIRKWIDLKRTDVAQSLAYIGSVIPAFDTAAQQAIINNPVAQEENLALRSLYFGV